MRRDNGANYLARVHRYKTVGQEEFITLMTERNTTVTRQDVLVVLDLMEETLKKRVAALVRLKEYEAKHRRALERLGEVTCQPTHEALAEIAGVSVDTVSRAVRRCENELRAWFR